MSGIGVANNFDIQSTKVIDNRCAGPSADTNSLTYKAPGLLRYETDNDEWKYYDGTNFVDLIPAGVTYTQGEGVSIDTNTNVISIGQSVDETDDVTFNSVTTNLIESQENGNLEIATNTGGTVNTRVTITNDGNLGLGTSPTEKLHILGDFRIDNPTTQTITFHDTHGGQIKEHGRIELTDNGGGADILFYTRPSGGNDPTEKMRINNQGAIGLLGANYGNSGQVLTSNGSGSAVSWADQTDTTYTQGTGVTINGSNEISIGQAVGTTDNVEFNDIYLNNGKVGIGVTNPSVFLEIATGAFHSPAINFGNDSKDEQGLIFISNSGNKDLNIQANSKTSITGISLGVDGFNKLRLSPDGEFGLGTTENVGEDGAVLISQGSGNPVEWRPRVIATAYLTNNIIGIRGAETIMKPLTVEIELGSGSYGYNATTGEYIVPVDGIYSVHYSAGWLDADGASSNVAMNHSRIQIHIDTGSGYVQRYNYTTKNSGIYDDSRIHSSVSAIIDLSQGEKLQCRVGYFAPDSDSVLVGGNSPAYCFQSIHLIG